MVRRHELTDEQYAKLAPLPPPERPATGRPNKDHRTVLNGILFRVRTGVPWRDLPERYGPWQMVGSLSEMFAAYYRQATADEGQVTQTLANFTPGFLGQLIPEDYQGDALPLWRFIQESSAPSEDPGSGKAGPQESAALRRA